MMQQFATIWEIVEARKTFPATIVITSATVADDTAGIARGLAGVAQSAGQRTGYLQLDSPAGSSTLPAAYGALSIAPRADREALDSALASWRTRYDVVIINAGTFQSHPFAAHLLRIGDAVVIAVGENRRVVAADRELARVLADVGATVIGAVMTTLVTPPAAVRVAYDRSRLETATQ